MYSKTDAHFNIYHLPFRDPFFLPVLYESLSAPYILPPRPLQTLHSE